MSQPKRHPHTSVHSDHGAPNRPNPALARAVRRSEGMHPPKPSETHGLSWTPRAQKPYPSVSASLAKIRKNETSVHEAGASFGTAPGRARADQHAICCTIHLSNVEPEHHTAAMKCSVPLRIADMLPSQRPRERLAAHGADALSAVELIAILLGTGIGGASALDMAQRLLTDAQGIRGLVRLTYDELLRRPGLGAAKAARLQAAIELSRRAAMETCTDRPVRGPEDAAALLAPRLESLAQEELHVLLLDAGSRVIRVSDVYRGSVCSAHVRAAEVFRPAVHAGAVSVVIAHNHPSGDPGPSPEDVTLTRWLVEAGSLLGIEALDHLVIGAGRYVSMRAEGLGFDDRSPSVWGRSRIERRG